MDTFPIPRRAAMALGALTCAAGLMAAAPPALAAPAAGRVPAAVGTPTIRPACAAAGPYRMACRALRRSGVRSDVPSGLGPADFRALYGLAADGGAGQTVAIIDAYDDPSAASDLATYRSTFGLAPLAPGQLTKINQDGQASPLPGPDAGWAAETSLDLDIVSAIAPRADILLVEATDTVTTDLFAGIDPAIGLGARYVTMSWGGSEDSSDPATDAEYLNRPGIAFTAPISDSGYGAQFPATSRFVTAVGGTSLSTGGIEVANGGGGCSVYESAPPWQQAVNTGCATRAAADVAAIDDPAVGVAVYDTYQQDGWAVYGGTSVASSIIIGVYALAGPPGAADYPASYPYADPADLHDITQGTGAGSGWDPPTGMGTPNGVGAFRAP